ncbi:protein abrupt-like [Uranotaenia lowii]|uniref:protein abrupt-like n=1 Tax=Uranotaenia lowii TaxID=190385 RepID=UPI00247A248B|nr:protein abrupt-like [Uranotaenia lowii]
MMDEFALRWNNFADNIASGFQNLYDRGDLVDVTIACDGYLLKAHKIVLAICSPYFQEMFVSNPCKHPIIVLKDVSQNVMQELLQFMYQGEVNVKHSELQSFMKIAETLQIKGLTASHKNDRDLSSPAEAAPQNPTTAPNNNNTNQTSVANHLGSKDITGSSTSQLDAIRLNSYLAAATKDSLKRAAADASFSSAEQYPIHYPKKTIKRSTDSIDQDSNSDCMDNLSSDDVFIPHSPQVSMVEQSSNTSRQFDTTGVKRENINDSSSSPHLQQQSSPTNLTASSTATAAAAAAALKLGFSSTPTNHHSAAAAAAAALHPMFGVFDPNSSSYNSFASSLAAAASGGNGDNGSIAGDSKSIAGSEYSQDFGRGIPGHMDIPAVAPGEKWFQGRLQFMLSQRGKPLLVHDGHSFGIQYVRKDKKYWQCNLSRKYNCKARVTTTDTGDIIVTNNEHCHTEIRQHLRKDYKSMKQLNASLAALRARSQPEGVSLLGLAVEAAATLGNTSLNLIQAGNITTNSSNNLINNNNNNSINLNANNSSNSSAILFAQQLAAHPSHEQQEEQETSLNLSGWKLKKEPTAPGSE